MYLILCVLYTFFTRPIHLFESFLSLLGSSVRAETTSEPGGPLALPAPEGCPKKPSPRGCRRPTRQPTCRAPAASPCVLSPSRARDVAARPSEARAGAATNVVGDSRLRDSEGRILLLSRENADTSHRPTVRVSMASFARSRPEPPHLERFTPRRILSSRIRVLSRS